MLIRAVALVLDSGLIHLSLLAHTTSIIHSYVHRDDNGEEYSRTCDVNDVLHIAVF